MLGLKDSCLFILLKKLPNILMFSNVLDKNPPLYSLERTAALLMGWLLSGAQWQDRINGNKWKYTKFHLNIRKHFYCEVVQGHIPQGGCGASIHGDIQDLTGHGAKQPAGRWPGLSRVFELDGLWWRRGVKLKVSLLTASATLWFSDWRY